ncbi:MAG: ERF family protein [bacterium]
MEENTVEFSVEEIKKMSVKEKIVRVSNDLHISKTGWNDYSKYAYITPEDIDNPLKPLLLKYRLFAHFNMKKLKDGKNEAVLRVEDFDTEVDRKIYIMTSDDIVLKATNSVQSLAGLRTFCRRYLLMACFSISDNSDDFDTNDNKGEATKEDKKAKTDGKKLNPDEVVKADLIELCKQKIADGVERELINTILKKFEETSGSVAKMTTANAKQALKEVGKLAGKPKTEKDGE